MNKVVELEPEARALIEATAKPPFLFTLGPEKGRAALDEIQAAPVDLPSVDVEDLVIVGGPSARSDIRVLRPKSAPPALPAIVYIHGGGWVFGDGLTHDRLIRELASGAEAAVVFPLYQRSPEAKYPTALEECYAAVRWVAERGPEHGLDPSRLVVAGDDVGGTLAAALTLLARERGGPTIAGQLLFYPVVGAALDTDSGDQFAEGYYLRRDAMRWFWNQYTMSQEERKEVTVSPLRANLHELRNLPPTLVITAEADVLRDEGEAFASHLRAAGVRVTAARFLGTIHDFVMLNSLANSAATRGALSLATAWLRERFAGQIAPTSPETTTDQQREGPLEKEVRL
jgi:acetyl esterase